MSIHQPDKVAVVAETDSSNKESNIDLKLAPQEHAHLSVGDIFRGTAVNEMTIFQRKAALINA